VEKRAEYLAQYEKTKKPQVKPTWKATSPRPWCGGHLLPEKKKEHFQIARTLRVEKLVADLAAGKLTPDGRRTG
jgi:hypothetical protein